MAAQVPATLKGIQPYLKIAQEYEKRDAVVAYYCKYGSNIAAGVCFVQQMTQLLSFYLPINLSRTGIISSRIIESISTLVSFIVGCHV